VHVAVAAVVPVETPPAQFETPVGVTVDAPQHVVPKYVALVGHQVVALPVQAKPPKDETTEV